MSQPAIQADRLTKRFGSLAAIHHLSLDVPAGAVFVLAGPSGAGKTTALKTLLNIHRPTAGRAAILGVDSRCLSAADFLRIGYVSENQDLPDWMTVARFFAYCRNFYPDWSDADLDSLVRSYALPLDRPLRMLSRGMRMKAALASSLAFRPRLLLLDEPFTALDVLVRDQLIESILERVPETTVLLASHDLAEIESFASHIAYMNDGTVRFTEEMTDLVDRFRDVEIRLSDAPPELPTLPSHWLHVEYGSSALRYIDPHFERDRTEAEIRNRVSGIRAIEFRPMPLRSIFVALAREGSR